MRRRPRSTLPSSSAASEVYKIHGIVNVLVDDITVDKTVYVMDVETFIEHAERVATDITGPDVDNDNDNNNEDIEF